MLRQLAGHSLALNPAEEQGLAVGQEGQRQGCPEEHKLVGRVQLGALQLDHGHEQEDGVHRRSRDRYGQPLASLCEHAAIPHRPARQGSEYQRPERGLAAHKGQGGVLDGAVVVQGGPDQAKGRDGAQQQARYEQTLAQMLGGGGRYVVHSQFSMGGMGRRCCRVLAVR